MRERGVKNDSKVSGLSNCKDGVATNRDGKDWKWCQLDGECLCVLYHLPSIQRWQLL